MQDSQLWLALGEETTANSARPADLGYVYSFSSIPGQAVGGECAAAEASTHCEAEKAMILLQPRYHGLDEQSGEHGP